jgi:hypothetical protein
LPGNVARYAAPKLSLFLHRDTLALIGRRACEEVTLPGFVRVIIGDAH